MKRAINWILDGLAGLIAVMFFVAAIALIVYTLVRSMAEMIEDDGLGGTAFSFGIVLAGISVFVAIFAFVHWRFNRGDR